MLSLAFLLPLFQQFDNGLLHPLGCVALGEILPQDVGGECHFVEITFLFLTHDDPHHIKGQMSLLAVLLEPLGLGERGGGLFAVHRVQKLAVPLF